MATMEVSELRVAVYSSNFFRHDGVTITCRRVIADLKRRGAHVRVITTLPTAGFPASEALVTRDEIITIPSMDFPMPTFSEKENCEFDGYVMGSRLSSEGVAQLEAFAPNVMHVTTPDGGALAAALWALRTPGVGLLATWHSNFQDYVLHYPLAWLTRPIAIFWLRLYCAHMPLTLVPTAALCDELAALGFRKRSMSVWGRGVDARVFAHDPAAASALRAELVIGARTLLLCWTSRIVREKRFDIFTTVFDRLKSDGFDVHALVAGVPSDESGAQMLEKFRASHPSRVSYLGWCEARRVAQAYAASDVLLFPSEVETFGNVTLEGMATGLACVVDERCSSHLVEHGCNGFTVRSGDVEAYYTHMRRLCDGAEGAALRKRLGDEGRRRAVEQYEAAANTQEILEHYRTRVAIAQVARGTFSLQACLFALTSEVVLFGFFWGATLINKTLALAFWLLGV